MSRATREARAMAVALDAARQGPRGANPLVGAVVLDGDGNVRATGHHAGAGTAHAEAFALAALGPVSRSEAAGMTMLVTLEPCNHTGRTGPCAQAIVDSGIGRVVYATADGTERAGGGAERLRAAGIDVEEGMLAADSRTLNHRWFAARAASRPFTTLHLAQTLDGRIAALDGTSQWITGPAARAHSHGVRSLAEAIIAGTGTVLADDPRLTARTPTGEPADRQPLRVVMGRRDVPAGAAVRGDGNWRQLRTHDPSAVLADLADAGIDHAMVEGGSAIATAFLAADLVDELWLYQAPILLGSGRPAVGDLGIQTLGAARRWRYDAAGGPPHQQLGDDVVLHLEPAPHPAADSTTRSAPAGAEERNQ